MTKAVQHQSSSHSRPISSWIDKNKYITALVVAIIAILVASFPAVPLFGLTGLAKLMVAGSIGLATVLVIAGLFKKVFPPKATETPPKATETSKPKESVETYDLQKVRDLREALRKQLPDYLNAEANSKYQEESFYRHILDVPTMLLTTDINMQFVAKDMFTYVEIVQQHKATKEAEVCTLLAQTAQTVADDVHKLSIILLQAIDVARPLIFRDDISKHPQATEMRTTILENVASIIQQLEATAQQLDTAAKKYPQQFSEDDSEPNYELSRLYEHITQLVERLKSETQPSETEVRRGLFEAIEVGCKLVDSLRERIFTSTENDVKQLAIEVARKASGLVDDDD